MGAFDLIGSGGWTTFEPVVGYNEYMSPITHGEERENNSPANQGGNRKANMTLRRRIFEWIPAVAVLVYFLYKAYFFKIIPTIGISAFIFILLLVVLPIYIFTRLITRTTEKAVAANKKYLVLAWVPAILFILILLYWIFTLDDQLAGFGFFYMFPGALVIYGVSILVVKSFVRIKQEGIKLSSKNK